jgi:hypothetical protein
MVVANRGGILPVAAGTRKAKNHCNLMSAQEASYYYDYQIYASSLAQLSVTTSNGVVLQIFDATATGWAATATHPQAFPLTCGIFVAGAPPRAPADVEGLIGCK